MAPPTMLRQTSLIVAPGTAALIRFRSLSEHVASSNTRWADTGALKGVRGILAGRRWLIRACPTSRASGEALAVIKRIVPTGLVTACNPARLSRYRVDGFGCGFQVSRTGASA